MYKNRIHSLKLYFPPSSMAHYDRILHHVTLPTHTHTNEKKTRLRKWNVSVKCNIPFSVEDRKKKKTHRTCFLSYVGTNRLPHFTSSLPPWKRVPVASRVLADDDDGDDPDCVLGATLGPAASESESSRGLFLLRARTYRRGEASLPLSFCLGSVLALSLALRELPFSGWCDDFPEESGRNKDDGVTLVHLGFIWKGKLFLRLLTKLIFFIVTNDLKVLNQFW